MRFFIIGFMGTGKTTLAKKLSKKLNMEHVDTDVYLEEKYNCSISQLFETHQEEGFRLLEHKALLELIDLYPDAIISCGGGLPCFHNNMTLMNTHGSSFYLDFSPKFIYSRLINKRSERPLIAQLSEEELLFFIEKKLEIRHFFYKFANYRIKDFKKTLQTIRLICLNY